MKRLIRPLAALCLLLMLACGAAAEQNDTTLRQGDKGQAVLALKQRMYELGYFTSTNFSAEFNATTKERLIELQKKNGWPADGVATPELQALIFSDACLPRSAPDPTPVPGDGAAALLPEDGEDALDFLPEGQAPVAYASRAEGVWRYVSPTLHIEIRQHTGKSAWGANLWLEASIRMKDPAQLVSLLSQGKKPGGVLTTPAKIMESNGDSAPVLAFNDDFFGYRVRYLKTEKHVGVIVRDGHILYDDPKPGTGKHFPPLDILAVFEDGTMKTFQSDAYTAQEYVDMGVRHTFAFGPILVQGGEVCPDAANWATGRAPRLAMGVTAEGLIKVVNVLGRRTDARGVNVAWMAAKMHELGCVEALNLDGGNTTCLIFMGDMINRPEKTALKDIRRVSGLIAIEEDSQ